MIIAVSGMVGTGKSTLTELLAARLNLPMAMESIGTAHPWLDAYYASMESRQRYALHSQLHFLSTAVEDMESLRQSQTDAIVDGTLDEDAEVFAALLAEEGILAPAEYQLYCRIYKQLIKSPGGLAPEAVIYLEAPVDFIKGRIQSRGRVSEKTVEEEYWNKLHKQFQEWIFRYDRSPVVRVDVSRVQYLEEPTKLEEIVRSLREATKGQVDCPELARAATDADWQRVEAVQQRILGKIKEGK